VDLGENQKGLRVKDQCIQQKAFSLFDFRANIQAGDDECYPVGNFLASSGWLLKFKMLESLVRRRPTSCRVFPNNADEVARGFLQTVHSLTDMHNIQPKNIIILAQVPRYFDTEPTSTIAARGSRSVLLRKVCTSHKIFTVTF
jgi:hypothetical protein